jgi:glycosyltransferase involved in cell wall biosynthesis
VNLRTCFVITGLATGGAEMMLLKLLTHSERLRNGATVLALRNGGELVPRFRALGVAVEEFGVNAGPGAVGAIGRLARRLRALAPDVVSTWMYHADLVGGLAARWCGIPVVWGIRNSDLDPARTKRMTRAVVRACALLSRCVPRAVICCSERARAIHVALGYDAGRFHIVPNGFDLDAFKPDPQARASLRAELGVAPETPLVGLVARFDPQKNHAGFFEAAAMIARARSDANFVLAGSGVTAANPALMRAARAAGAPIDRLHWLGLRSDMPRLMAGLDVLVSASSYGEAFPNVLGEAMACAVPCVTTAIGDSAEIVADTGIAVAPGDMAGLADGVLRLLALDAPARRALGERARARVARCYDIRQVAVRYEELLIAAASTTPHDA